ncbi:hypothetical protein D3W54_01300 [Komagataeibacter medellinensis]|uniref:Uncharacterized protein n=1 Tax=Komagataeibacter medellinensis TaxID=1177712 RepID=A0ABQ6VXB5_9PROT|nr:MULTISPECIES: hypothetical protein [Komagataeibacter]KAB8123083.1 hypothetical protein D3W54_01300 [Komagataeibacter medellinensis]KDU96468.1 hypothetical protein GLUCORHAEAF1_01755 [Komagataeibacter rhaeticus AF1]PYD54194.1 hypothetical protein CFR78_04285 [Komagataeibacter rhaeticus]GBQ15215.1 hypothetical protein AA16663_2023 [Komagataeibacter rhaeticus DSM 16663]
MTYAPWIAAGVIVIIAFIGFLLIRSDAKKAQKAKDEATATAVAQDTTTVEVAMAQAGVDAPTTDSALDARLDAGTA